MATQPTNTAYGTPARDCDGRHALSYNYRWECDQDARDDLANHAAREAARNSLETLGAALDNAAILFRRQADRPVLVPSAFARAERRYLAARDAYMARLAEVTGEEAHDLQRRVAA
jgi:hypothetical protein